MGVVEKKELQAVVTAALPWDESLRVLEAGCGSRTHITLPENAPITGIDISEGQLERNTGLTEKILDDLQTHRWPADSFDLVLCWDVLEHLPRPSDAIARLGEGLRPGGLMVLALPNLMSLKGLVTKFTPYWAHVAFYRYIIGDAESASAANRYRTFLKKDCAPERILAQGRRMGMNVVHYRLYEGPVPRTLRQRSSLVDKAFALLSWTSRRLGNDLIHSEGIIVLQRPAIDDGAFIDLTTPEPQVRTRSVSVDRPG